MIVFTTDEELRLIAEGVMDCTLPKSEWTHAAHLAAAVCLLSDTGLASAERQMPGIIRAYNEATGVKNSDTDGYHETITLASLRAVDARLKLIEKDMPLFECLNIILASKLGRPDWLFEHWTRETLFSVKARHLFCEPDKQPLPF